MNTESFNEAIFNSVQDGILPVILVSGFDEDSIRELSNKAGALDFVAKGELSAEVLEQKIANVA